MTPDPIPQEVVDRAKAVFGRRFCMVCAEDYGGSHYHCGRCLDIEPTSMMGHLVKFADGEHRMTCDEANLGKTTCFGHVITEDDIRPVALDG